MTRRTLQQLCLALSAFGALLSLLHATIGTRLEFLGPRFTVHDSWRPLALAIAGLVGYRLAGGRLVEWLRAPWAWIRVTRTRLRWPVFPARTPGVIVIILILAVWGALWLHGSRAAGGSDPYGYLSQAHLWLSGSARQSMAFIDDVPWPGADVLFSPLGYTPAPDRAHIVPTYSPGMPWLMALAMAIGGFRAAFLIMPIACALVLWGTYALGTRLGSAWSGAGAAWLMATCPTFLMISLGSPMSDILATAAWIWCFLLLSMGTMRAGVGAGVAAGFGVLVRLNLAPLAIVPAAWSVLEAWRRRRSGDATWWMATAGFIAGILPCAIAAAWNNDYLYGSPLRTGYGNTDILFSLKNVLPNIRTYSGWFNETQTPVAWIGVAAACFGMRWLWDTPASRRLAAGLAAFTVALGIEYAVYLVWDAWWYLRFVLPAFPFVFLALVRVGERLTQIQRRLTPLVALGVVLLGVHGASLARERFAFDQRVGESKYVAVGRIVRGATEPSAVILSMQHSGNLRFYGGRMTLRYDRIERESLASSIAWLADHGAHPYALLDEWEVDAWRRRFAGAGPLGALEWPPLRRLDGPSHPALYDLVNSTERPTVVVPLEPKDLDITAPAPARTFRFRTEP